MSLEDVKKFKVLPLEADEHPGNMEPIALYGPDGTPLKTGGSAVTSQYIIQGPGGLAVDGNAQLEWEDQSSHGLFDLTDPTLPVAVDVGLYIVTTGLTIAASQAGKKTLQSLVLDVDGAYVSIQNSWDMALGIAGGLCAAPPLTLSAYLDAGSQIKVEVTHDGTPTAFYSDTTYVTFIPMSGVNGY